MLATPLSTDAQSLLKGLKDRAKEAVGSVVGNSPLGGILGDSSDDSSTSYKGRWNSVERPKVQTPKTWDGQVKPCTANSPRELLAAFPDFPTAEQVASNSDRLRNYYNDQVYAVMMRCDELSRAIPETAADRQKAMSTMRDDLLAEYGMSNADISAMQSQSQDMAANLGVLGTQLAGSVAQMQKAAEGIDVERMTALTEELDKLENKKKLTPAEEKRMEEIYTELAQMSSGMMAAMEGYYEAEDKLNAGNVAVQKKAQQAVSSGSLAPMLKTDYDKKFDDFTKRLEKFIDKLGNQPKRGDDGCYNSPELDAMFAKLWAEPSGSSQVSGIYAQIDSYINNFYIRSAEARIKQKKALFEEAKQFLGEAEYFAANVPAESAFATYQLRRAPYKVIELCADALGGVYEPDSMDNIQSVMKTELSLPLMKGDQIYSGESFCKFMTKTDLSSLSGAPAPYDNLAQDFLKKAVFLVYNSDTRRYYKLENGRREELYGSRHDFFKRVDNSGVKTIDIPMKSLDATIRLSASGCLYLPDGSTCYPLAVQRTEDWLIYIDSRDYEGKIYKCMFRL